MVILSWRISGTSHPSALPQGRARLHSCWWVMTAVWGEALSSGRGVPRARGREGGGVWTTQHGLRLSGHPRNCHFQGPVCDFSLSTQSLLSETLSFQDRSTWELTLRQTEPAHCSHRLLAQARDSLVTRPCLQQHHLSEVCLPWCRHTRLSPLCGSLPMLPALRPRSETLTTASLGANNSLAKFTSMTFIQASLWACPLTSLLAAHLKTFAWDELILPVMSRSSYDGYAKQACTVPKVVFHTRFQYFYLTW